VSGALDGIIVVELATRASGELAGKLLADLGADVIKVEPPSGSPTRAMGPFKHGESTLFAFFNANKRSVMLDLSDPGDRALLDSLLGRAQLLIDDHDEGWAAMHGLSPGEVAKAHPHLVHCAITPFGQGAPPEWQQARPINVINAGGWAWHTPTEADPDKPPLKGAGRFLSSYEAAIDAAMAASASLLRQRRTGAGQFIDISEVEVQLNRIDCVLGRMLAGEAEPSTSRRAYDLGGPATSFDCREGQVFLFMTTKAHWKALCELMGNPDWAQAFPKDWLEFHCTPDRVQSFRDQFRPWIAQQDKHAISEAAQKLGFPLVPVNTAADLPANPQFVHRGFFQQAEHPAFGAVHYPTAPYRMSRSPVRIVRPAPGLDADRGEVLDAPA
jgi:crotonobetainyl-CoA:carnitine CoA-transferase CaiB-like acyl-CoA transferase